MVQAEQSISTGIQPPQRTYRSHTLPFLVSVAVVVILLFGAYDKITNPNSGFFKSDIPIVQHILYWFTAMALATFGIYAYQKIRLHIDINGIQYRGIFSNFNAEWRDIQFCKYRNKLGTVMKSKYSPLLILVDKTHKKQFRLGHFHIGDSLSAIQDMVNFCYLSQQSINVDGGSEIPKPESWVVDKLKKEKVTPP